MLKKFPRTQHLFGSRIQKGDEDLELVGLEQLSESHLVIEEKIDGSNVGISFEDGELHLQSRGHYLRGGPRERQYDILKQWAACHEAAFRRCLGERYIMYGEWMYAKHTCFYDLLPHYFMEFDLYDKEQDVWGSTTFRRRFYETNGLIEQIESVAVLAMGRGWDLSSLKKMIKPSLFKSSDWKQSLENAASKAGQDPALVGQHTDPSSESEGLYIKRERGDKVEGRYKFVRESFTNSILEQDTHWHDRVIIPNELAPGAYERMFVW